MYNFIRFTVDNWEIVLTVLILIIGCIYCIVNKKWTELRVYTYKLIQVAENTITGSKMGGARFLQVFEAFYNGAMPSWLKIFIPVATAEKYLQIWYTEIKDLLDNGKCDKSVPYPVMTHLDDETIELIANKLAEVVRQKISGESK